MNGNNTERISFILTNATECCKQEMQRQPGWNSSYLSFCVRMLTDSPIFHSMLAQIFTFVFYFIFFLSPFLFPFSFSFPVLTYYFHMPCPEFQLGLIYSFWRSFLLPLVSFFFFSSLLLTSSQPTFWPFLALVVHKLSFICTLSYCSAYSNVFLILFPSREETDFAYTEKWDPQQPTEVAGHSHHHTDLGP